MRPTRLPWALNDSEMLTRFPWLQPGTILAGDDNGFGLVLAEFQVQILVAAWAQPENLYTAVFLTRHCKEMSAPEIKKRLAADRVRAL